MTLFTYNSTFKHGVRCLRHIPKRTFASSQRPPFTLPTPKPISEPGLVDEERVAWYEDNNFYPAKPGEVIGDRFQLLVKLGWGGSSTTWMARDIRDAEREAEMLTALKITNCDGPSEQELEIEQHIAQTGLDFPGHALLRLHDEHFEIDGPCGKHLCLAYSPCRESFDSFKDRFLDSIIPFPLVKFYLQLFLETLDSLHTGCNVVHTDLKLNNIMVGFENDEVVSEFMDRILSEPSEFKTDASDRQVFRQNNDFGPVKDLQNSWLKMVPRLTDFGSSMQLHGETGRGIFPIQANCYRAPEVTLGFPWNRSADIWSLGALIWDLTQDTFLFQQAQDKDRRYTPKAHLAEMIGLLGMPSPEFIEKSHSTLMLEWPYKIRFPGGELSQNAFELFGGPFFDKDGKFLHEHLIPDRKLEDTLPSLEEEERTALLSFAKKMLVWDPEQRATARELLEDPFLNGESS